jgi:hypothetical protein
MKYTKPNVLATAKAGVAIQTGDGAAGMGGTKNSTNFPDSIPPGSHLHKSTTGAYEADE